MGTERGNKTSRTCLQVDEISHTAEASMRCNRKGWGSDFFKYITIEPLYTEAW